MGPGPSGRLPLARVPAILAAGVAIAVLPGAARAQSTEVPGFNGMPFDVIAPRIRVVVDPDLGTPAHVSFEAVGGFPVDGGDPAAVGRAVLRHPMLQKMYGTLAPDQHLWLTRHAIDHAGQQRITFEQREQGARVLGAYLAVTVAGSRKVSEIHSRVLYFPQVDFERVLPANAFVAPANDAYARLTCEAPEGCGGDLPSADPATAELVILSSRLLQGTSLPPGSDRLAWRFGFPEADVFVEASGKLGVVLTLAAMQPDVPRRMLDCYTGAVELATDGTLTTAAAGPGAMALDGMMDGADKFYGDLGRNGYDASGGGMVVLVNCRVDNAAFILHKEPDPPARRYLDSTLSTIVVGPTRIAVDTLTHEFTHGVTATSAGLIYAGESGALNESFSDVLSNLAFPDANGGWLQGEDAPGGPVRDLANPSASATPGVDWQPDHVARMDARCLSASDKCVHEWSGVPNLAAVLIADGGISITSGISVPSPGLGRAKVALLWYHALTGGRLGPGSNFLSLRLATISECEDLVASGLTFRGSPAFTPGDCAAVALAFDAVGISAAPRYGWTRFTEGLTTTTFHRELEGKRLFNGCTIADQTVSVWSGNGPVRRSNIASGLYAFDIGLLAFVTQRGSAADLTDRSATVMLTPMWVSVSAGYLFADQIAVPAGLNPDYCHTPDPVVPNVAPRRLRTLYSTTRVSHWATFFNGGRFDEVVNAGVSLPAGCEITAINGVLMRHTAPVSSPSRSIDTGSRGFTVSALRPDDPRALDALVHSWHDGLSAVSVVVAYDVLEPPGTECLVAGALRTQP